MVFKGLNIHMARFHSQSRTERGGGLFMRLKIPVQELWLKLGGRAYTREGAYSRDTTVHALYEHPNVYVMPTYTHTYLHVLTHTHSRAHTCTHTHGSTVVPVYP